MRGKIFNVGQNSDNYRIREIAQIVAEEFPGCEVTVGPTERRQSQLPRELRPHPRRAARIPVPAYTARDGARQLREVFERIQMPADTYQFRAFTRLKQIKYLQSTSQIDGEFFWR